MVTETNVKHLYEIFKEDIEWFKGRQELNKECNMKELVLKYEGMMECMQYVLIQLEVILE